MKFNKCLMYLILDKGKILSRYFWFCLPVLCMANLLAPICSSSWHFTIEMVLSAYNTHATSRELFKQSFKGHLVLMVGCKVWCYMSRQLELHDQCVNIIRKCNQQKDVSSRKGPISSLHIHSTTTLQNYVHILFLEAFCVRIWDFHTCCH